MVHRSLHFLENHTFGARFAAALMRWLAALTEGKIKVQWYWQWQCSRWFGWPKYPHLWLNLFNVLSKGLSGIMAGLKRLEISGVSMKKLVICLAETHAWYDRLVYYFFDMRSGTGLQLLMLWFTYSFVLRVIIWRWYQSGLTSRCAFISIDLPYWAMCWSDVNHCQQDVLALNINAPSSQVLRHDHRHY